MREIEVMGHPVLLVEDDWDVREALAVTLEEFHEVRVASDGAEGLQLLRAGLHPCVILLDLMMPVMNGFAFRREQRADPALADIPVIVVSCAVRTLDEVRDMNVAAVLPKPVDCDRMLGLVAELCPSMAR
jgi:CheY-like chemotaxis protein